MPNLDFFILTLLQDYVIIQLEGTGLMQRNKQDQDGAFVREDDPILVVHPNYVIDG